MPILFLLCVSLSLVMSVCAVASDVPPHFSGLAGQLIKTSQAELATPSGSAAQQELIRKAFAKLKSRSMHRYAGKGAKLAAMQASAEHVIELQGDEHIGLQWDAERQEFVVSVSRDAGDDLDYRTQIRAKTRRRTNDKGEQIIEIDPEQITINAKDAKALTQELIELTGRWRGNMGYIWIIRMSDPKSRRIELARLREGVEGDEDIFTASYKHGKIQAISPDDDVRDMLNTELPMALKQKLLARGNNDTRLNIAVKHDEKTNATTIEGVRVVDLIRYNRNSLKIVKVMREAKSEPFKLERVIDPNALKIASLQFDLFSWYTSQFDVQERLAKARSDLDHAQSQLAKKQKERAALTVKLSQANSRYLQAKGTITKERQLVAQLEYPEGTEGLRRQIETLAGELEDLALEKADLNKALRETPKPALQKKYEDRLKNISAQQNLVKAKLAKQQKALNSKRAPNWKTSMQNRQAYLDELRDTLIISPSHIASLEIELGGVKRRIRTYEQEIAALKPVVVTLEKTALRYREEGNAIQQHRGLITDVVVQVDGATVFHASREDIPYAKVLKSLDAKIAKTREAKAKAAITFRNATANFVSESQDARSFLDQLYRNIIKSYAGQTLVEGLFVLLDTGVAFAQGGPAGAIAQLVMSTSEMAMSGENWASSVNENAIASEVEREMRRNIDAQLRSEISYWQVIEGVAGGINSTRQAVSDEALKSIKMSESGAEGLYKSATMKVSEWARSRKAAKLAQELDDVIAAKDKLAGKFRAQLEKKAEALRKINENLDALRKGIKESSERATRIGGALTQGANALRIDQTFSQNCPQLIGKNPQFKKFVLENADKIAKASPAFAKELAKGSVESVAKDLVKTAAKSLFTQAEARSWHSYFYADALARLSYGYMVEARRYYWALEDELAMLLQARKVFIQTHDASSGFKIITQKAFDKDAKLTVSLMTSNAQAVSLDVNRAHVMIADVAGKPSPEGYRFDASAFEADSDRLALSVIYKRSPSSP